MVSHDSTGQADPADPAGSSFPKETLAAESDDTRSLYHFSNRHINAFDVLSSKRREDILHHHLDIAGSLLYLTAFMQCDRDRHLHTSILQISYPKPAMSLEAKGLTDPLHQVLKAIRGEMRYLRPAKQRLLTFLIYDVVRSVLLCFITAPLYFSSPKTRRSTLTLTAFTLRPVESPTLSLTASCSCKAIAGRRSPCQAAT